MNMDEGMLGFQKELVAVVNNNENYEKGLLTDMDLAVAADILRCDAKRREDKEDISIYTEIALESFRKAAQLQEGHSDRFIALLEGAVNRFLLPLPVKADVARALGAYYNLQHKDVEATKWHNVAGDCEAHVYAARPLPHTWEELNRL